MARQAAEKTIDNPVRAGRPTREQAEARHEALLDTALDHFLEKGFEQATIDAIAAAVNMTKRTVYARYPDKVALFHAAVSRGIERYSVSAEMIAATRAEEIDETLINFAHMRIGLVATPEGLRLQRIINTESYRFPGISEEYYTVAALPSLRFLARLFREETEAGRLSIEKPAMAANMFLALVATGPVRRLVAGDELDDEALDRELRYAVRLFLDGALPR